MANTGLMITSLRRGNAILLLAAILLFASCSHLKKFHEKSGSKTEETPAPASPPAEAAVPVPAAVKVPDLSFTLESDSITPADRLLVQFNGAVPTEGARWWITVIQAGRPDTDWGDWTFVEAGGTEKVLPTPAAPGDYEVRLHANYPAETTHLVSRMPVTVTP